MRPQVFPSVVTQLHLVASRFFSELRHAIWGRPVTDRGFVASFLARCFNQRSAVVMADFYARAPLLLAVSDSDTVNCGGALTCPAWRSGVVL